MKTLFIYVPLAVAFLTFFVFVKPLKLRVRHEALFLAALLLASAKFLALDAFFGNAFAPDVPAPLLWTWDLAYYGALALLPLAILAWPFRFRSKALLLPLLALAVAFWGLYNGIALPRVHEVVLSYADLPDGLSGYRIVQLADLHCSSVARRARTQAIVDSVNALEPDLICITGDNVDGFFASRREFIAPLAELKAKDGVLACTGNHEHYFDFREWKREFYDKTPIRFLMNECVFPRPGLAVAGVPDAMGCMRERLALPDPGEAFAAATNGEFRVLLQHRPGWAEINARYYGVRLQLSGHTHGGIAPLIRRLVAKANGGWTHGAYKIGEKGCLYVSPGCGQWAGFQLRYFNPSEITLITLEKPRER